MKRTAEEVEKTSHPRKKQNVEINGREALDVVHPVLNIYKPVSKTPKEVVVQLKNSHPAYKDLKVGYAGRLDPMARGVLRCCWTNNEGILLCLVGEENKKRKDYEFFTKEYIFKSVLGVKTDTYDILGLLTRDESGKVIPPRLLNKTLEETKEAIQGLIDTDFKGKFNQPYPPYSSARVQGKLLFQWAKEGKLDQIEIPSKQVEVMSMEILSIEMESLSNLYTLIEERIRNISSGEFRQEEILGHWKDLKDANEAILLPVVEIKANVSHGTYVRSLSHDIGNKLGIGAVVVDLLRTRVHDFHLEHSFRLDDSLV